MFYKNRHPKKHRNVEISKGCHQHQSILTFLLYFLLPAPHVPPFTPFTSRKILPQAKYQDNYDFMLWVKNFYDLNAPPEEVSRHNSHTPSKVCSFPFSLFPSTVQCPMVADLFNPGQACSVDTFAKVYCGLWIFNTAVLPQVYCCVWILYATVHP